MRLKIKADTQLNQQYSVSKENKDGMTDLGQVANTNEFIIIYQTGININILR